jgi:predicted ATP-grasp superfamily ATP-dependent carboligase
MRLQAEQGVEAGVLIATSDDGARELAEAASALPESFHFAGPRASTVALLMDKRCELGALANITDSLPPSLVVLPDTKDAVLEHLRFPIIMKPRTQKAADTLRMKTRVVNTGTELEDFFRQFADSIDLFVAQEVIPGGDDTVWQCNAVFNARYELVSAFTFQKLGMSPPHYGVTTMGRSARNDDVIDLVRAIGMAIGYVGPAGFEFKRDTRDGRYRYIEINPRHGMTNWFDTSCGVNSTLRNYQLALGDQDQVVPPQPRERVFVDAYSDLFSRLADDREPAGKVLRRYVALLRESRVPAYWMWRDPAPGLVAFARNLAKSFASLARRVHR